MKVCDLIEMLEGFDPELEVQFAYNYGDHWRTTVSASVDSVTMGKVEYSDYHRMDKLVSGGQYGDEDEGGQDKPEAREVVILE